MTGSESSSSERHQVRRGLGWLLFIHFLTPPSWNVSNADISTPGGMLDVRDSPRHHLLLLLLLQGCAGRPPLAPRLTHYRTEL